MLRLKQPVSRADANIDPLGQRIRENRFGLETIDAMARIGLRIDVRAQPVVVDAEERHIGQPDGLGSQFQAIRKQYVAAKTDPRGLPIFSLAQHERIPRDRARGFALRAEPPLICVQPKAFMC